MAANCLSTADEVKLLLSSGLCILLVTLLQATIKEGYPLHHLGKFVILSGWITAVCTSTSALVKAVALRGLSALFAACN